MTNNTTIIAWKKLSRRSELLAKALDAKLWVLPDNIPYIRAALKTLFKIIREKPSNLIVQLPQGPLLLETLILKKLLGCKVIADVHTGFLLSSDWRGLFLNAPFLSLLHYADLIIAHNSIQIMLIPKKAEFKTIVVLDPWNMIMPDAVLEPIKQKDYLVFPASFASDEPLEEVINSVNSLSVPELNLYITGNWKRKPDIKEYESKRIMFTGFLPNEKYAALLAGAKAIITGTKREYTSLMSAWEAVAYNKPLILNGTQTLKNIFSEYATFYNWKDVTSISKAIANAITARPNISARKKLKLQTTTTVEILKQKMRGT